jgi:hypothetical protein
MDKAKPKPKAKAKRKAVKDHESKPTTPAREFVDRVKAEERRKHKAAFDEWIRSLA